MGQAASESTEGAGNDGQRSEGDGNPEDEPLCVPLNWKNGGHGGDWTTEWTDGRAGV